MAIPSTTIYICRGVRLNNTYDHTIWFNRTAEQSAYFDSKVCKTLTDYVYQRKSWDMRVSATMVEAKTWSYLFFSNPGEWRRMYYFINDVEYENDNTVILKLELDVMQTYLHRFTLRPCFVEREHTNNDTLGANTVDESLDVGEYVVNSSISSAYTEWAVLIHSTVDIGTSGFPAMLGTRFNGIYSGLAVFACSMSDWEGIGETLRMLDEAGKSDAIVGMYMYPQKLLTLDGEYTWSDANVFKRLSSCKMIPWETTMKTSIDGYTPKNNKVKQYPYNYLYVTNNNGGAAVYKYEYFGDVTNIVFNTFGVISPEAIAGLYPLNYKGVTHNYDEKLTLTGFPSCAWNSDVYKLWLAQTQNQRNTTTALNALTIAASVPLAIGAAATGNGVVAAGAAGTALHAASSIAQLNAQKADKAIAPPQAHGAQSGGLNMVAGVQEFTIYNKCVDAVHAKIIDDYFSLYGYAVKRVKTPNITSRESWNYIKTVGSNVVAKDWDVKNEVTIESSICVNDLNAINRIFDKGITFWHDPEKVGDYTQSNLIK